MQSHKVATIEEPVRPSPVQALSPCQPCFGLAQPDCANLRALYSVPLDSMHRSLLPPFSTSQILHSRNGSCCVDARQSQLGLLRPSRPAPASKAGLQEAASLKRLKKARMEDFGGATANDPAITLLSSVGRVERCPRSCRPAD